MNGLSIRFADELEIITDDNPEAVTEGMLASLEEQIRVRQKELRSLCERRDELRKRLTVHVADCPEMVCNPPLLSKDRITLHEKAELLFSLFHGRRDVYAARKYKGYYPVCINHNGPSCPRKGKKEKINCVDCPRRQFAKLTPDVIVTNHLCNHDPEGKGAIGIYPMLTGNSCMFAAIDFDEATWKQDSLCVASVARKAGFQVAIEVSFSGNGAHLWLFFFEAVPARKARKLMMSFLDEACRKSETIRLTSYDRIFPAQDELKKDGIGNLILMPLVLSAASRQDDRGTLFVDNSFRYYPGGCQ